jgi:hypothetical protein
MRPLPGHHGAAVAEAAHRILLRSLNADTESPYNCDAHESGTLCRNIGHCFWGCSTLFRTENSIFHGSTLGESSFCFALRVTPFSGPTSGLPTIGKQSVNATPLARIYRPERRNCTLPATWIAGARSYSPASQRSIPRMQARRVAMLRSSSNSASVSVSVASMYWR